MTGHALEIDMGGEVPGLTGVPVVEREFTFEHATLGTVASDVFTHDGAGRRILHERRDLATGSAMEWDVFYYDALGRLRREYAARLASASFDTDFFHDPTGHRFRREDGLTGTEARYFGEWLEHRGGETTRLVHGGGLDRVLAEVSAAGSVRTYMPDGSNHVTHVVVDGALEPSPRRYEAFGALRAGASVVERGFAGRPTEGDTGLVYLRARHYDPATGRFLQTDPLGLDATQLYAYARNNPYVYGDPLGLDPIETRAGARAGSGDGGGRGASSGPSAGPATSGSGRGIAGMWNGVNRASQSEGSVFDRFRILGGNETFVPGIGGGISIVPKEQAAEFLDVSLKANAALAGAQVGAAACALGGCQAAAGALGTASLGASVAFTVYVSPRIVAAEAALFAAGQRTVQFVRSPVTQFQATEVGFNLVTGFEAGQNFQLDAAPFPQTGLLGRATFQSSKYAGALLNLTGLVPR